MPSDPVAALLFDLDGTLVDTEFLHYQSTLQVIAEWDVHLTEKEFGSYIGYAELPYWEDLRQRLG